MPPEEMQALDVVQAPLFLQFPEGEVNSADMSADEFYQRLEAMRPAIPTTAQPSAGLFADLYRQAAHGDKQILSIHVSSGLSGTLGAAQAGAELVAPDIEVNTWDSLTLSGGERFQVLAAAYAARAGWARAAIQQRLEAIRARTEVIFTLETLEYLVAGGRIGRVQAIASKLLNIKPIIHVEHHDGRYGTVAKARTLPRALTSIADHLHSLYAAEPVWVSVMHGRFAEQAAALAGQLRARLNVARMETMRISPVLGVHTGPGIVGAAVAPMALLEDLA
jgi:DegV family protein with EDD domain